MSRRPGTIFVHAKRVAFCEIRPRAACLSRAHGCIGQATVEYLIVGAALLCIITALGLLSGQLQDGLFVQHTADSASHALTINTAGSAGDVLLY